MKTFAAFLLTILAMVASGYAGYVYARMQGEDIEDLRREYTAYRHCLQAAGSHRCRMTPQDFVRYYDIKHRIEAEDG